MAVNDFPVFFIFWNFFLLLVPLFLGVILINIWQGKKPKSFFIRSLSLLIWLVWLLFLPNAPYLIADLRHISGYCGLSYLRICVENGWMPVFFFLYAVLGWIGFVFALWQMKIFLSFIFEKRTVNIIVLGLIPLTALGLLLGLINRFNSWDVFTRPMEVLFGAGLYFTDWLYFRNFLLYTIMFYILYFLGNALFGRRLFDRLIFFKNKKE